MAILTVLADCTTKREIVATQPVPGVPRPVVGNVLRFTLGFNPDAAFSTYVGSHERWLLLAITGVMLVVLARMYATVARAGWVGVVGLALVFGGAVGNAMDRIVSSRGVVDFIDVGIGASRFYVFNVADIGVSIGASLLVVALWHQRLQATGADAR